MGRAKAALFSSLEAQEREAFYQDLIDGGYLEGVLEEDGDEDDEGKLVQITRQVIAHGTDSLSGADRALFRQYVLPLRTCGGCARIISTKVCGACLRDSEEMADFRTWDR